MERQFSLEESLLSLGQFEEAYSELWEWLMDALKQLGEAEPITGDPDVVAAQLAKHKVYIYTCSSLLMCSILLLVSTNYMYTSCTVLCYSICTLLVQLFTTIC